MNFWIQFWSWFFFISLALFCILEVVVLVGGFLNIRSLFKSLSRPAERRESDAPHQVTGETDRAEKLP
jgi:uncharacterized protein YpmS